MHTPILGFRRFIWHAPVLNIHEQCAIFDLNVFQIVMIYPFSYFETPFVDHLHMELTYFLIYVIIFFLYKSYIEGEIMMISKRQQPVFCHCVKYFLMVLFIIFSVVEFVRMPRPALYARVLLLILTEPPWISIVLNPEGPLLVKVLLLIVRVLLRL